MVFICKICKEKFDEDEMSEEHNICINCFDDEETMTLIALDII